MLDSDLIRDVHEAFCWSKQRATDISSGPVRQGSNLIPWSIINRLGQLPATGFEWVPLNRRNRRAYCVCWGLQSIYCMYRHLYGVSINPVHLSVAATILHPPRRMNQSINPFTFSPFESPVWMPRALYRWLIEMPASPHQVWTHDDDKQKSL